VLGAELVELRLNVAPRARLSWKRLLRNPRQVHEDEIGRRDGADHGAGLLFGTERHEQLAPRILLFVDDAQHGERSVSHFAGVRAERVDSTKTVRVDVRVIAASNQDLRSGSHGAGAEHSSAKRASARSTSATSKTS
jgi:hypothetical protein